MPAWIRDIALRLVIAFAMTVGLVLSPISVAISHGPGMLGGRTPPLAAAAGGHHHGHGHSHDDDGPTDRAPGHAHHNPADHSHDQPDRAIFASYAAAPPRETWWVAAPARTAFLPPARLDRPPRPFSAA